MNRTKDQLGCLLDKKLQIHRWIKRDWIEALTKHCRRLNRADQSHWDGDLQKNQRIALKLDILRKQCLKNVNFKNCLIWWVTFWIAQSSSCLREAMLRRATMVADLPLQHWECENKKVKVEKKLRWKTNLNRVSAEAKGGFLMLVVPAILAILSFNGPSLCRQNGNTF